MDDSNPYRSPQSARSDNEASPAKLTLVELLFSFDGRIPRRAYWGATLAFGTAFLIYIFALDLCFDDEETSVNPVHAVLIIPALVLQFWIPLALNVKRWHDRDMSGWWMLINLIPFFGGLFAFVQTGCLRGTLGPNEYGPDPT